MRMLGQKRLTLGILFLVLVLGAASRSDAQVSDFLQRCSALGVIKCVGFDSPSDITGTWGSNSGNFRGSLTTPQLDTSVKASGNSSILFVIPSNSDANSSGAYFTNFSPDLSIQFGENSEFYIQWRQRFSPCFLYTGTNDAACLASGFPRRYLGAGGWKQSIITTGDKPGCTPTNSTNCYASCEATEVVTQNNYDMGFAEMYNSCSGSSSHGPYDPFSEPFGPYDFKLQNARPSPYCLFSQGFGLNHFPPVGNCFAYFPNEWMTFQVNIKTGSRVNDVWKNSFVRLWIAREGRPSELVIDWGPYDLTAGPISEDQKFGKVWLLPFNTSKDSSESHPTAYTWYDELIISRVRIADPASSPDTSTPSAPTNLSVM